MDFEVKECKDKGGLSAKTKEPVSLDIERIASLHAVSVKTPILCVIEEDGGIVVHKYGEIIFKTLRDQTKIREIAGEIYAQGLANHNKGEQGTRSI